MTRDPDKANRAKLRQGRNILADVLSRIRRPPRHHTTNSYRHGRPVVNKNASRARRTITTSGKKDFCCDADSHQLGKVVCAIPNCMRNKALDTTIAAIYRHASTCRARVPVAGAISVHMHAVRRQRSEGSLEGTLFSIFVTPATSFPAPAEPVKLEHYPSHSVG